VSLKEAFAGMRDAARATPGEGAAPPPAALPDAPFNTEAVVAALEGFAPGKERSLRAALAAYPPALEGQTITFGLDNELLLAQARELQPVLLAHFRQALKNGRVALKFSLHDERQDDPDAPRRLYTAQDKLDYFLALKPEVRELQEHFGLELL
jgi:hypothetical protein